MITSNERWIIGEPGGPSGPFYSVVSQSGRVIAMQIIDRRIAEALVKMHHAIIGDFDTTHEAGKKLGDILSRDFPDNAPDELPIDEGAYDYVVRSVAEALFGEI